MEKSDRILVGRSEICIYSGFGKSHFAELIKMGFPAIFWGGKWRAHTENIEAWMQSATRPRGVPQDVMEEDE